MMSNRNKRNSIHIVKIILSILCIISSIVIFVTFLQLLHQQNAAAQQQQKFTLHRIDQRWIDVSKKLANRILALNGSNSSAYLAMNQVSFLLQCINDLFDNNTLAEVALSLCDAGISMDYSPHHLFDYARDPDIPDNLAMEIGINNYHDLAKAYLQSRGIL